ncbi:MAG: CBS domain-containing protein [Muribaculum sp.]|nr:CBS domain-containing protein [Muribaculum sp.]
MTAKDAISAQITPLRLPTTFAEAADLLKKSGKFSLPVVDNDGRYVGVFSELPLSDDVSSSRSIDDSIVRSAAVNASYPVTSLLDSMVADERRLMPVVDDDEMYAGAVDADSMLVAVSRMFPRLVESTELTVTCPAGDYSASAIAHAVEDADAHLLNLNVVEGTEPNSRTTVLLRVNHSRGESVARSLARYGYDTVEMSGTSGMENAEMASRINEFLHYLEV